MQTMLYIASGIILSLLILAEITIRFFFKSPELRQRLNTWWGLTAVLLSTILLQGQWVAVLWGAISFFALREYVSLIPLRQADRPALWACFLSIPLQYYWVATQWYGMFIIFIPVYMLLILPLLLMIGGQTQGFLHAAGRLHWGLMITVFSVSHAAFLQRLSNDSNVGAALLLCLLFLTAFNDIAQYVWGKSVGRHKITPHISPNKTWEGFLGGVLSTTLLMMFIAPYLTPLTRLEALAAGLIIGVGGFFGDLSISAIKRDVGIKDSGNALPGHGGILDRLDSLMFTAPLFFHFVRYFHF
ncbi:MAG: putative rane associated CTP-phosphosubstrate transferase [Pseudomonadota bacterium]|jgi:phosphatidate cytidylyltransferase